MTPESIAIIVAQAIIILQLMQMKKDVLDVKQNQVPMIQKCCDHENSKPEVINNVLHMVCETCGLIEEIG